ncbi:MAG: hypothetical protein ACRBG0_01395 [Lewinella sp.]|uniref:hypothetical protein n=1 Tax=Lewinella sp. TaxID=2004506 RepID=UPI003D6BCC8D
MSSKKARKVSFKLFLNKSASRKESGFHPVYLRITYNRQNTKVPDVLVNGRYLMWKEEDLEAFENDNITKVIRGHAKHLKKSLDFYENIIRYEDANEQDDYSVIGIADRARFFRTSIFPDFWMILEYLEQLEYESLFASGQINAKYPDWTFPKKLEELGGLVSEGFKRMQELYALVILYDFDYYNDYKEDYIFGSTYYHWIIDDGLDRFKDFLTDYFGSKSRIDEDYLTDRLSDQKDMPSTDFHLKMILEHLPPKKEYQQLYINLLKNHCGKFASRDK